MNLKHGPITERSPLINLIKNQTALSATLKGPTNFLNMKYLLALFFLPVISFSQGSGKVNENPPVQIQQFQNISNVNFDNVQENNQGTQQFFSQNQGKQEEKPCTDCDVVKEKRREHFSSGSGSYSGGGKSYKAKKKWKRFCHQMAMKTSRSKKVKTNYSVCFNW
jgi:hypothetical protein